MTAILLTRITRALAACADAADALVAVALLDDDTPADAYRAAVDAGMTTYEAAETHADLLLDAIIEAGGARGLLGVLDAAAATAHGRVDALYARRLSDGPGDALDRALAVAEDAHRRAVARDALATARLAIPYYERRMQAREAA